MTEAEWVISNDAEAMVQEWDLGRIPSHAYTPRKARLFSVACARQLAQWFDDPVGSRALDAAERHADGLIKAATAMAWRQRAVRVRETRRGPNHAFTAGWVAFHAVAVASHPTHGAVYDRIQIQNILGASAELGAEVVAELRRILPLLLRDVVGNPFRPVTFSPQWRTSTAVAIAQGMYESRDFSPMPILADSLQDAGCDSADVLDHCRDPHGVHVRGCWVVDGVLGKA